MLFIQMITKKYDKSSRSGESMRKINEVRFKRLPDCDISLEGCEYFFHDSCRERAFPYTEHFSVSERVYIDKENDSYIVSYAPYTTRTAHRHFKPVMTLADGEYGRIVYNERAVTYDTEWYYVRTTINLYNTDSSKLRENIFFRKQADHLFEDMAYLRYCGDYHKA